MQEPFEFGLRDGLRGDDERDALLIPLRDAEGQRFAHCRKACGDALDFFRADPKAL